MYKVTEGGTPCKKVMNFNRGITKVIRIIETEIISTTIGRITTETTKVQGIIHKVEKTHIIGKVPTAEKEITSQEVIIEKVHLGRTIHIIVLPDTITG